VLEPSSNILIAGAGGALLPLRRRALLILFSFLLTLSPSAAANEKAEIVYTSPGGAFRIEMTGEVYLSGKDDISGDLWLISAKNPTRRVKLPKQSSHSLLASEFHSSPNEEWILGLRHVGSGLQNGDLYHRVGSSRINMFDSFSESAWESCLKLKALDADYSAEGVYAMTYFVCWSFDSSRLLVQLRGGEEKRALHSALIYFNTRTQQFETTDYLRKLNKAKSAPLPCAEPVDSLLSEGELKKRLETLDAQLNKKYREVIAQTGKDRISVLRQSQRDWLKRRDEGAELYVSLFPAAEKERRRLQFLGDVTLARVEVPPQEWEL